MPEFETTTGLGYIEDTATGRIVAKCAFETKTDESGNPVPSRHPIKEGFRFVEVATKEELDRVSLYTAEEIKSRLIAEVKGLSAAKIALHAPDFKILRHREQVETGAATTLTAKEHKALLALRQSIRDASNAIESEINALGDVAALEVFNVAGHPAWPI